MTATEWTIRLKDGTSYKVPPGARVRDLGYSLVVERPCMCSRCGDVHSEPIEDWAKPLIDYAGVTQNGMTMAIVPGEPQP